jgi:hypothetical protein
MAKDKRSEFDQQNQENPLPGNRVLFNADERTLQETTVFNDREVYAFAVGDVKDAVVRNHRKLSVYQIFKVAVMRNKKSLEGRGIDDIKELYHVSNEEKQAEQNRGALFG